MVIEDSTYSFYIQINNFDKTSHYQKHTTGCWCCWPLCKTSSVAMGFLAFVFSKMFIRVLTNLVGICSMLIFSLSTLQLSNHMTWLSRWPPHNGQIIKNSRHSWPFVFCTGTMFCPLWLPT